MNNLPTIKELASLLISLKPTIQDDYRASCCDFDNEQTTPDMDVTIGWTPEDGSWDYQTGDNSFTGGAYCHPHWGVVTLNRRSNSRALAKDIISQLADCVQD